MNSLCNELTIDSWIVEDSTIDILFSDCTVFPNFFYCQSTYSYYLSTFSHCLSTYSYNLSTFSHCQSTYSYNLSTFSHCLSTYSYYLSTFSHCLSICSYCTYANLLSFKFSYSIICRYLSYFCVHFPIVCIFILNVQTF